LGNIQLQVINATDAFLSEGAVTHELLDADWTVTIVTVPIIEGVSVTVYDQKDAVLNIGSQSLEFSWTHEAAQMFLEIDNAEPVELLEMLFRLQVGVCS
jgi:hypothetical protein